MNQFWLAHLGWTHSQQPQGPMLCQEIQKNFQEFHKAIFAVERKMTEGFKKKYTRLKVKEKSYQIFGDVRYRLQARKKEEADRRIQQKLRARFGTEFFANEYFSGRFSISTGRSPTSSNANLGDSFSYKSFGIHEASLTIKPIENISIALGKMQSPFKTVGDSEIVWDATLTPEGGALVYQSTEGRLRPFFSLGYFLITENYRKKKGIDQPDTTIAALQLGTQWKWKNWEWTVAGGPVHFAGIQGAAFKDIGDEAQLGNSDNGDDQYLHNFHLTEAFMELIYRSQWETGLFAHRVENTATAESNRAYRLGVYFEVDKWQWLYAYRKVEKDSVFGYFTESNFGFGGTDQQGHEANIQWKIHKKFKVKLTQQWARLGAQEKINSMKRTHLDFQITF